MMRCALAGLCLAIVAGGGLFATAAAAADSVPVFGRWITGDGDAKVELAACSPPEGALCGRIVWLREPNDDKGEPQRDVLNPDPALRSRRVVGVYVFDRLTPDTPGRWKGRIYDPDSGRWYDGAVSVQGPAALRVTGCRMMFCRSERWRRD